MPGPIARIVTREAVRLALTQQSEPSDVGWSRVRKLEPGTEITVTVRGSQAGKRTFVSADESGLTVLDLAHSTLPAAATRVLRDMASNHPGYLTGAETAEFVDRDVRVGPDGVFVADQRVADLAQIVEKTARTDVVEVRSESARRHPAAWGALIGAAVGAAVEGASIGGGCGSDGCYGNLLMALFAGIGAGAGAGIGAAIGAFRRKTQDDVIYRVP